MTFPHHAAARADRAAFGLSIFLVVLRLLFNAPLEELANPREDAQPGQGAVVLSSASRGTPLHYYPPLVSGVLLPGLVILALAVIPLRRDQPQGARCAGGPRGRWPRPGRGDGGRSRGCGWRWPRSAAVFFFTGAHPVWPVIAPLWAVAVAMSVPALAPGHRQGLVAWLGRGPAWPFWGSFASGSCWWR